MNTLNDASLNQTFNILPCKPNQAHKKNQVKTKKNKEANIRKKTLNNISLIQWLKAN